MIYLTNAHMTLGGSVSISTTFPSTTGLTASVSSIVGDFSVAQLAAASYFWELRNGTITSGQGTSNITFTAGAADVLLECSVRVDDQHGIWKSRVQVRKFISASLINTTLDYTTQTGSTTLKVLDSVGGTLDVSNSGYTYQWSEVSGGTITGSTISKTIAFIYTATIPVFRCTITTPSGVSRTIDFEIDALDIPNGFRLRCYNSINSTGKEKNNFDVTDRIEVILEYNGNNQYFTVDHWDITGATIEGGFGTLDRWGNPSNNTNGSLLITGLDLSVACILSTPIGLVTVTSPFTIHAYPDATITAPASLEHGDTGIASVPVQDGKLYTWHIYGGTIIGSNSTHQISFQACDAYTSIELFCEVRNPITNAVAYALPSTYYGPYVTSSLFPTYNPFDFKTQNYGIFPGFTVNVLGEVFQSELLVGAIDVSGSTNNIIASKACFQISPQLTATPTGLLVNSTYAVYNVAYDGETTFKYGRGERQEYVGNVASDFIPSSPVGSRIINLPTYGMFRRDDQTYRQIDSTGNFVLTPTFTAAGQWPYVYCYDMIEESDGSVYALTDQAIYKKSVGGEWTIFVGSPDQYNGGYTNGQGTSARLYGSYTQNLVSDGIGNLYFYQNNTIRKIELSTAIVSTFIGVKSTAVSTDGDFTTARFNSVSGLTICNGDMYVCDYGSIRKITFAGNVTTIAGTSGVSFPVTMGSGTGAILPSGGLATYNNDIYLASTTQVLKITTAGVVTLLAGQSNSSSRKSLGGLYTTSLLTGMRTEASAVDNDGNLYVVSNDVAFINKILKVTPSGVLSTFVTLPSFPYLMTYNSTTNMLYVALNGYSIYSVSVATTAVTSIINNGYGYVDGNLGKIANVTGITSDPSGNIYILDSFTIRKITGNSISAVTGVYNTGGPGNTVVDGDSTTARLYIPKELAYEAVSNTLVFTDLNNKVIRRCTLTGDVTTIIQSIPSGDGLVRRTSSSRNAWLYSLQAANGYIYYVQNTTAENIVRRLTQTGELQTLFGNSVKERADGKTDYGFVIIRDRFLLDGIGRDGSFINGDNLIVGTTASYIVGDYTIRKMTLVHGPLKFPAALNDERPMWLRCNGWSSGIYDVSPKSASLAWRAAEFAGAAPEEGASAGWITAVPQHTGLTLRSGKTVWDWYDAWVVENTVGYNGLIKYTLYNEDNISSVISKEFTTVAQPKPTAVIGIADSEGYHTRSWYVQGSYYSDPTVSIASDNNGLSLAYEYTLTNAVITNSLSFSQYEIDYLATGGITPVATPTHAITSGYYLYFYASPGIAQIDIKVTNLRNGESTSSTAYLIVQDAPIPYTVLSTSAPAGSIAGSTNRWAKTENQASTSTFAWTIENGTITSGASSQQCYFTMGNRQTALNTTLQCTITNARGVQGSGTILVPVLARPLANATISPYTYDVIHDTSSSASVGTGTGYTYAWTITNGTITSSTTISTITYTAGSIGDVTLGVTVTNLDGAPASSTFVVHSVAYPLPNATIGTPANSEVHGVETAAWVSAQDGCTYVWTVSNGTITGGQGTADLLYTVGSIGPVTLGITVTNQDSVSATGFKTIQATAASAPLVTITATTSPVINTTYTASVPAQNGTFVWSGTAITIISGQGTRIIEYSCDTLGAAQIDVTVTNIDSVSDSSFVTLDVVATAPLLGTVITFGTTASTLTSGDPLGVRDLPTKFFKFEGTSGQYITLVMDSVANFDTFMYLLDDSGNVLESNDDGYGNGDSQIFHTLPYTGWYQIQATSYGNGTGAFNIMLTV